MPYCSRCGVEVDGEVESCPLCGTAIQKLGDAPKTAKRYPDAEDREKPRLSAQARRRLVWEVTTLLAGIAIVVVIGTDLRSDMRLSWSLYPTASVILAWIYSTLFLYFRARLSVLIPGLLIGAAAFLAGVDWLSGGFHWFLALGLPILLMFAIIAGLVTFGALRVRIRGFNIVAFASFGISLFCAGTDALIARYFQGTPQLTWSVIVMLVLVPFGVIMLFLHYRLRNRFDLKRLFRL